MKEPAPAPDGRSFLIRELVNSFRRGGPIALFTASSLVAPQAAFLEPDLTIQLRRSIGNDRSQWAHVLANILVSYPGRPLTLAEVRAGKTNPAWPHFTGFPLAQLALSHLPSGADAETLVWRSLIADMPGFADEPYHPLFAYNPSFALHAAEAFLSQHRDDPVFIETVKAGLRRDRSGFSFLAARLIDDGQKQLLPDGLDRAMKLIRRPAADGDDLLTSIRLVIDHGTDEQRGSLAALAVELKDEDPDYALLLERQLSGPIRVHPR
jgi:hypothetical protein